MVVIRARVLLTGQYIGGAFLLAQRAAEIESVSDPSTLVQAEHQALVVAAVMQAAAAIESELADILQHGPGHHLGSKGTDTDAHDFIEPIAGVIDRTSGTLERWDLLLHLLRKPALNKGRNPYQDTAILVGLRNELVHYRSNWHGKTRGKWLEALKAKQFARPPFVPEGAIYFPERALSATCARWAAETATDFIDSVSSSLGVRSVLDGNRHPMSKFREIMPPNGST